MRLRWVLMLAAALAMTGGCKWLKSPSRKDNIEPPAELVKFDATLKVRSAWRDDLGKGERQMGLRQAPVFAEGRIFAASPDGRLQAYDAANGRTLWSSKKGPRWSGGPGAGEGTLVVGTLDGEVVAFNPDSGSERWRARVSSEVISRPAIARGVVVVRSQDGRVYAFSTTTGERRWVFDRGLPSLMLRGNAAPVIDGAAVFIGYDSGDVVALKLDDGSQLWEQGIAEGEGRSELERMVDIDGDMVASGSELFVAAYNSRVVALDIGSGRPLWNRDMSVYGGLVLSGDRLLVADAAGTVWALDRRTGASLWRQDGLAQRWLTTPAVHAGHAVVGDFEGYLHWLSLEDGAMAARERVGRDPLRAAPLVAGELVYAVNTDGKLAAFSAAP